MLSAKYYAQSTVAFEEVALKFVEREERDALRNYLLAKVDKLRKGVGSSPSLLEMTKRRSGSGTHCSCVLLFCKNDRILRKKQSFAPGLWRFISTK